MYLEECRDISDGGSPLTSREITLFGMLTWCKLNHMSEQGYQQLRELLLQADFDAKLLPHSIKTIKNLETCLPLIPIHLTNVEAQCKSRQMGRVSKSQVKAPFYHLPSLVQQRVVEDHEIFSSLWTGLGTRPHQRSEMWHGDFWHESIAIARQDLPFLAQNQSAVWPGSYIWYSRPQIKNHDSSTVIFNPKSKAIGRVAGIFRGTGPDGNVSDDILARIQPVISLEDTFKALTVLIPSINVAKAKKLWKIYLNESMVIESSRRQLLILDFDHIVNLTSITSRLEDSELLIWKRNIPSCCSESTRHQLPKPLGSLRYFGSIRRWQNLRSSEE
ncbi:hypothetical protein BT69DRAFT_313480 [Atractiella rhizophila]|nr:hypothetical protein BT69DRAFT_313480 [Atractiella rhizophila]